MRRPSLAAITFDAKGGGVAGVARLLRQVFRDRWGDECLFFSLLDKNAADRSLTASTASRFRFGAELLGAQVSGRCSWVFYSHLSLARVQAFVPQPLRRPYGVFLHGVEVWRDLTPPQRRILQGAALRIANSNLTARRVADAHPEVGPIAECPLALPPPDDDSAAVAGGSWPIGSQAVVLVARMLASERYKGHDELLKAWPAVLRRVPDARLVFVGDGDDVTRLRSRAATLGVAEAVVFTGFVSAGDLEAIYRQAAVFAMPSCGEGFGMVYLEAMAHRLPCIGSIHDAATEVIEDGVTGFLVEQADRQALIDRVVGLLSDEGRRAEMGERGYRRLQERFTYAQFARGVLDLIDSTLAPAAAALAHETSVAR